MTFKKAKKRLAKLAKGEYYVIYYQIANVGEECGGGEEQECTVYVAGFGHFKAKTWETALRLMDEAMNPPKIDKGDIDEIDVDNQSAL